MSNRLFVDDLNSVGLVAMGDDPEAKVTLFKSATMQEEAPITEAVLEKTDVAVTDEVEETVETAVDSADDVTKQSEEIAKLNAQIEELRKEAEHERALRKEREATDLAAKYELLGDWKDVFKDAPNESWLRVIAEKLDALNERMKMQDMFKEVGDGASEGVDVFEKQKAFVKEYKSENPGTSDAQARAEFWRQNPDLREEARNS